MQNEIGDLLRRIANGTPHALYNDPLIDGIHRNFPDLLYNNTRFTSIQSLMEYITHEMINSNNNSTI